ncbi:hypothetical protein F4802DRAFT_289353 [Xylaria palmicola]|nr:hypothetical protein F4802DRAFT_289353 [Xylaria palmicola]
MRRVIRSACCLIWAASDPIKHFYPASPNCAYLQGKHRVIYGLPNNTLRLSNTEHLLPPLWNLRINNSQLSRCAAR